MPNRCVRRSLLPRAAAAAVALGLALPAAGCGGGSQTTSTTPARSAIADQSRAVDVQQGFVETVRALSPSVVQIQTQQGLGSGVVYDNRGDIVTNNHVVGNSTSFTGTLQRGDRHRATLVGTYPPDDLAVIRLRDGSAPVARFGDSAKLQVGDLVLAIGNPLGLRSSVTQGIVSSLDRTVSEGGGVVIPSAVQTSAPINPGNSGGALVDLAHEVVGIPTLAAVDPELGGTQAPGIGFAIPSNLVRQIAPQLIDRGKVTTSGRAYLGVEVASGAEAPGVVVAGVERGGPAASAGLRRGDVIVSVAGKPVQTADDLATVLASLRPGQRVPVRVRRADGSEATVQVRLAESPG